MDDHKPGKTVDTYKQRDYPLLHADLPPARGPLGLRESVTAHNLGPDQTDCRTVVVRGKTGCRWCGRGVRGLYETIPKS